ncbi:MAG: hypothetical protein ACLFUO_04695 [Candidatus Woesearchaeota archaeon]
MNKKLLTLGLAGIVSLSPLYASDMTDASISGLVSDMRELPYTETHDEEESTVTHTKLFENQVIDGNRYDLVYVFYSESDIPAKRLGFVLMKTNFLGVPEYGQVYMEDDHQENMIDGNLDYWGERQFSLDEQLALIFSQIAPQLDGMKSFIKYCGPGNNENQRIYDLLLDRYGNLID